MKRNGYTDRQRAAQRRIQDRIAAGYVDHLRQQREAWPEVLGILSDGAPHCRAYDYGAGSLEPLFRD